jgi:hypothetical protein
VDSDSLGEDRGGEPRREREQRGVPALSAALDPVTLQPLLKPVGCDVLAGVPAGDQPPVGPRPLKLLVAQRLRDAG